MKKKIIIILLITTLCISPVTSANWDCFQGDIHHTGFQKDSSDFVTNTWIFNMESKIIGTPAMEGHNMYAVSQEGVLKCIDMEDGSQIWSMKLDNQTACSPIVDNGTVYIGTGESFYAIDNETHKTLWNAKIKDVKSAPCVYKDQVYFATGDGHIHGLDKNSGNEKLNANISGDIDSAPLIVNDTIYIGSADGKLYSLDLNGEIKWSHFTGDQIHSTPAYGDGRIIFGSDDGNLYVLNETNGSLLFKVELDDSVKSSATVDEYDNNIYIGDNSGNFSCIDLRDGTIKWSYKASDKIQSTSALSGSNIAFGSDNGNGYVLNKYTGEEVYSYNPGTMLFNSPITASPVIYGDSLFFSGNDGYIYSINLEKKDAPFSIFTYYVIAISIALLVIICAVIILNNRRKKKNKK